MTVTQPLRQSSSGGIEMVNNSETIPSEAEQIIMTRGMIGRNIGELPWDPFFGSGVEYLRHHSESSQEAIETEINQYCIEALRKYLPEVQLQGMTINKKTGKGGIGVNISIQYGEKTSLKSSILSL